MKKAVFTITSVLFLLVSGCYPQSTTAPSEALAQASTAEVLNIDKQEIFSDVNLAEDVTLALSGQISWPSVADSYEAVVDWSGKENEITTVLGDTVSVGKNVIRLTADSPSVQAVKVSLPYNGAEYPIGDMRYLQIQKSEYSIYDLDFMTSDEAEKAIIQKLKTISDLDFTVTQMLTLDCEAMNENLQQFLTVAREQEPDFFQQDYGDIINIQLTAEDECYFFVLNVKLGDSYVMGQTPTLEAQAVQGVVIYCLYGQEGLLDMYCSDLPSAVAEIGAPAVVISPQSAASAIADSIESGSTLVDMEFTYAYVNLENKLSPVWVFYTKSAASLGENSYDKYDCYAVNAITGEVLNYEMPR